MSMLLRSTVAFALSIALIAPAFANVEAAANCRFTVETVAKGLRDQGITTHYDSEAAFDACMNVLTKEPKPAPLEGQEGQFRL